MKDRVHLPSLENYKLAPAKYGLEFLEDFEEGENLLASSIFKDLDGEDGVPPQCSVGISMFEYI